MLSALDAEKVSTLGVLLIVGLLLVGVVVAVLARAIAVKVLGVAVLVGLGRARVDGADGPRGLHGPRAGRRRRDRARPDAATSSGSRSTSALPDGRPRVRHGSHGHDTADEAGHGGRLVEVDAVADAGHDDGLAHAASRPEDEPLDEGPRAVEVVRRAPLAPGHEHRDRDQRRVVRRAAGAGR